MQRILHIIGSPRTGQSASTDVAQAYIAAAVQRHPGVTVDVIDVWSDDLPEFDEEIMNAKYAHLSRAALTSRQEQAWAAIAPLAQRIRQADVLVMSVPMWNLGIPYRLKMLIDVVSQRDYLFDFDGSTFTGLATGRAVLVCARGINYATGSATPEPAWDFQKSYLIKWLEMIGIFDVQTVVLEQLLFGSDADATARREAKKLIVQLAEAPWF